MTLFHAPDVRCISKLIGFSALTLSLPSLTLADDIHRGISGPLDIKSDYAVTKKFAYGMLAPREIPSGEVTDLVVSSSGKYIVLASYNYGKTSVIQNALHEADPRLAKIPKELSLIAYNISEDKTTVLWKTDRPLSYSLSQIDFFKGGSDTGLALFEEAIPEAERDQNSPITHKAHFIIFDANRASIKEIMTVNQVDEFPIVSYQLSPEKPFGVLCSQASLSQSPARPLAKIQIQPVYASGGLGSLTNISNGFFTGEWNQAGDSMYVKTRTQERDPKNGNLKYELSLFNPLTGKSTQETKAVAYKASPPDPELAVGKGSMSLGSGSMTLRSEVSALFSPENESGPKAIIAANTTHAELISKSAVVFLMKGRAFVRPLVQVPKDQYDKDLKAAMDAQVLSQVKQVGLGLAVYAADHDGMLPSKGSDLQSLLGPYLKNDALLDGFVYDFAGGDPSGIQNPSATPLGHIALAGGGNAVVYLDFKAKLRY